MDDRNMTIVGLGRIGGFLSKDVLEFGTIEKLTLIDFDRVVEDNVRTSIYRKCDIGKFKTEALSEILEPYKGVTNIKFINDKFIEKNSDIPKEDLLIDCRDFIYDRGNDIDVRLYISSRYLIIDCKKNIKYEKHHEGKYITNLTEADARTASFNAAMFLINGYNLEQLVKNELIHKIELDLLRKTTAEAIRNAKDFRNTLFNQINGQEKFINLKENSQKIIKANSTEKIKIVIGDLSCPLIEKNINIKTITNTNELVNCLLPMISIPFLFNYYIVSTKIVDKKFVVELLPETGAA